MKVKTKLATLSAAAWLLSADRLRDLYTCELDPWPPLLKGRHIVQRPISPRTKFDAFSVRADRYVDLPRLPPLPNEVGRIVTGEGQAPGMSRHDPSM